MSQDLGNYVNREEGEKPFWISYSDLMTALMILFLVVMVASLTSISQQAMQIKYQAEKIQKELMPIEEEPIKAKSEIREELPVDKAEQELDPRELMEMQRIQEVREVCSDIRDTAKKTSVAAIVDCSRNVIDLGEAGRFDKGQYALKPDGMNSLHRLIPIIIDVAKSPLGEKWLKRVHIQGYTDTDGSYLYNLNLSLKRSEWVMCEILREDSKVNNLKPLTAQERNLAKQLFLVAGVSFNNQKTDKETSRRVEFKLEFFGLNESSSKSSADFPVFKDNGKETCQI